jgi:hypothetical protein
MTVFTGRDAVVAFLEALDGWLSDPVEVYLLGGSAMTVRGLKDQTEDMDFALGVTTDFEHVYESLRERGFEVTGEPTESFENVGKTVELHHPGRNLQIDAFERQVVGKVWITERMAERAEPFWSGKRVAAFVLSDEDMFLLKAVSGGDVGGGRRRDIDDMRTYARRGLDYDAIIEEVERQRPFNRGPTEARQIRDRSHPLVAIEIAVRSLSGLPHAFTNRVSRFATEFEVEYFVLGVVDDGIHDRNGVRERVLSDVRSLSEDDGCEVDAGIERLVEKRILERSGDTVRLR